MSNKTRPKEIVTLTANSRLPQVAVTWLIEGSYFYQSLVQVDSGPVLMLRSGVPRIRQLWQHADRW
jgi:hypothetical protein